MNRINIKLNNRSIQLLGLLCLLVLTLASCSSPPITAVPAASPALGTAAVYWPTEDWRTSSPEEQGMDSQRLEDMQGNIKAQRLDLHSLLVVRHGYLVSETYFGSYRQDTRHELYSVTKSFVSTLVGIAIDQRAIKGTDQRVLDFFPESSFDNPSEAKTGMTLEDVLTMRTGLDWEEGDPAYQSLYLSPDWVKYMLDKPMVQPPGSQFNYCSGCSHLLTAILQETTGKNPRDFAEENLFKPLGIKNAVWDTSSQGIPIGGWGLQITPREMAKLGYLYLHGGEWEGKQIVSAAWVENATQTQTATDSDLGYGYQWWTVPDLGAYAALGLYGQMIFVVPGADLVVVTTAEVPSHEEIFRLIEEYILPAIPAFSG
jgi:CubicO group peptidase (beta-lactamase class C family)